MNYFNGGQSRSYKDQRLETHSYHQKFPPEETNAVQKGTNTLGIFVEKLWFLFWNSVTSQAISALTIALSYLHCINLNDCRK